MHEGDNLNVISSAILIVLKKVFIANILNYYVPIDFMCILFCFVIFSYPLVMMTK